MKSIELKRLLLFIPYWILATILGALAGAVLVYFIYNRSEWGSFFAATIIFGVSLGISQWVVLRRYFDAITKWILATASGWFIGGIATIAIGFLWLLTSDCEGMGCGLAYAVLIGIAGMIFTPFIVGSFQVAVLNRWFRGTGIFVLVPFTIIGWAVGIITSYIVVVDHLNLESEILKWITTGSITGLIAGVITVIPMTWAIGRLDQSGSLCISYSTDATIIDNSMSFEYAQALNQKGVRSGEKGWYHNAIKFFSKAIDIDAGFPSPYYNRANAYEELGDLDNAIADYKKFLSLNSDAALEEEVNGILGTISSK